MSNDFDRFVKLEIYIKDSRSELLTGLDELLRLGLIEEYQVKKLCRIHLTCPLPEVRVKKVTPQLLSITTQAEPFLVQTAKVIKPKLEKKPNLVIQVWQAFIDELSIRWLLFLGIFLVVVSSAVLAASQWANFPSFGQYLILWGYTLSFCGIGFWLGKDDNLKLTSQTLKNISVLLVPINFWAMSSFGLGFNIWEWITIAIASISLTGITYLQYSNSNKITRFWFVPIFLLLSYLHLGWEITNLPLLATYIGIFALAVTNYWLLLRKQNYYKITNSLFLLAIWLLLLVRSLFTYDSVENFALAIALCSWLLATIYLHKERQINRKQLEESSESSEQVETSFYSKIFQPISLIIIFFSWLISVVGSEFWQTTAINIVAIHFFSQRLNIYWRRRDLTALFFIGLQSIFVAKELIPLEFRRNVIELAIQISNTNYFPESVYSITLFPYLLLFVAIATWLYRQEKIKLARYSELLTLLFGVVLTRLTFNNATWLTLNLLLSTFTLGYVSYIRKPIRVWLIYLTHALVLVTIGSAIGLTFPNLTFQIWGYILLLLMTIEWLIYLWRVADRKSRYFKLWYRSGWYFGLLLGIISYTCFLSAVEKGAYDWVWIWLVAPLMLTIIAKKIRGKRREIAAIFSWIALFCLQFLTLWQPETRTLGLAVATGLLAFDISYLRFTISLIYATHGLGLLTFGSAIAWLFPPLNIKIWGCILLVLAICEWIALILNKSSSLPVSLGQHSLASYAVLKDTAAPSGRADPSGGNGGSNKIGLTSDTNSSITESPHPGASQAQAQNAGSDRSLSPRDAPANPLGLPFSPSPRRSPVINSRYSINKYWHRSNWHYGLLMAGTSYLCFLWQIKNIQVANLEIAELGYVWLLIPIMLTLVARYIKGKTKVFAAFFSCIAVILVQLLTLWGPETRLLGLAVASVLILVNSYYLRYRFIAALQIGFALCLIIDLLWKYISDLNWLIVGAIAIWSLYAVRKYLIYYSQEKVTNRFKTSKIFEKYIQAADYWAIALISSELILLYLAYLVFANSPSVSLNIIDNWQYPVASILIGGAIVFRYWQQPNAIALYSFFGTVELVISSLVVIAGGNSLAIATANINLALLSLWLIHWLSRQSFPVARLYNLPFIPIIYAVIAIVWRLRHFTSSTGLITLGAAIVGIGISNYKGRDNKTLRYICLVGITLAIYELVIYQMSQFEGGNAADGFTIWALVAAAIAFCYRLVAYWNRKQGKESFANFSLQEIILTANIHWAISNILQLSTASIALEPYINPHLTPITIAVSIFLGLYAIAQGRSQQAPSASPAGRKPLLVDIPLRLTPTRGSTACAPTVYPAPLALSTCLWVYLGLGEIVATIVYARLMFSELSILDPWWVILTSAVALVIYQIPWQNLGWRVTPWQRFAIVMPALIALVTAANISYFSLLIAALFYFYIAYQQRNLRWSYLSLVFIDWGMARFSWQYELQPVWFACILGLSIIYIAQFDAYFSAHRQEQHYFRLAGSGLMCMVALFYQDTGVVPSVISAIAIFAGLGLRIRAFLFVGTITFILTIIYQLVILVFIYSFLKWIIGLIAGIVLISIAANFETKRDRLTNQLQSYIDRLKDWQ